MIQSTDFHFPSLEEQLKQLQVDQSAHRVAQASSKASADADGDSDVNGDVDGAAASHPPTSASGAELNNGWSCMRVMRS